ncbi:hypothetical protein PR202_ga09168 [Eleusine coracana subsp. coracana]|uniref:Defensin-like protein n=1 Tax=Eleusine coracana subsp. coracana TaxID=191504 RepID=A0AAV5C394_ELECO|nr:hypothetical protein PR202_ga09168 [Eleusine coracana subsp. coracana]
MEAWRKTALCSVLLMLLIAASSEHQQAVRFRSDLHSIFIPFRVVPVAGEVAFVEAGSCWKEDNHHTFCFDADCRMTCKDHGHADGRCSWGRTLWLSCECLAADC